MARTALELYIDWLKTDQPTNTKGIRKAIKMLEIERQQIIDTYDMGWVQCLRKQGKPAEKHYNDKYGKLENKYYED